MVVMTAISKSELYILLDNRLLILVTSLFVGCTFSHTTSVDIAYLCISSGDKGEFKQQS